MINLQLTDAVVAGLRGAITTTLTVALSSYATWLLTRRAEGRAQTRDVTSAAVNAAEAKEARVDEEAWRLFDELKGQYASLLEEHGKALKRLDDVESEQRRLKSEMEHLQRELTQKREIAELAALAQKAAETQLAECVEARRRLEVELQRLAVG
jgi:chromosome segregation ATPase